MCRGLINIELEDEPAIRPVAGESAQARFERDRASHAAHLRVIAPVMFPVALIFSIVVYFLLLPYGGINIAAVAAAFSVIGVLYIVVKTPRDVVNWERGAEAERRVGVKLDSLESAGFVTLYDRRFPSRGGNIDAVTVGPSGVFVVETKWRRKGVEVVNGRLEVGGWEQNDLINQAVDEALRVQISVASEMNAHRLTVVPVLCFVGKKVGIDQRSKGVNGRPPTRPRPPAKREVSPVATLARNAIRASETTIGNELPQGDDPAGRRENSQSLDRGDRVQGSSHLTASCQTLLVAGGSRSQQLRW